MVKFGLALCRLVYGKGFSYLRNDDFVTIFNLAMKKVSLRRREIMPKNRINAHPFILMEVLIKVTCANLTYLEAEEAVENLNARIKTSYERLVDATKFGKCLDLKSFKLFYVSMGIWERVKGKRVRKSPFGWWVIRKGITKLIEITKFNEVLVCKI